MVTLEQIKLLESKIVRAINFVEQLTEENAGLRKQNEELGETIKKMTGEKTRLEEGICSALGKLNQFEDAMEQSLSSVISQKPVQNNTQETKQSSGGLYQSVSQTAVPSFAEQPDLSSAYTTDEEDEETEDEEAEETDSDEAELDIF